MSEHTELLARADASHHILSHELAAVIRSLEAALKAYVDESVALRSELEAERKAREEAERSLICDVCLGKPLPSGKNCVCKGTGNLIHTLHGTRENMASEWQRAAAAESRLMAEQGEPVAWLPTAENINALPEPIRKYIHDIETRCDPAGDIAALTFAKDQVRQLEASNRLLRDAAPPQDALNEANRRAGAVLFRFIDRLSDPAACDLLDKIVDELLQAFDAAMQKDRHES